MRGVDRRIIVSVLYVLAGLVLIGGVVTAFLTSRVVCAPATCPDGSACDQVCQVPGGFHLWMAVTGAAFAAGLAYWAMHLSRRLGRRPWSVPTQ
jgi:hypothetical protein